jgi:hypothetical protein
MDPTGLDDDLFTDDLFHYDDYYYDDDDDNDHNGGNSTALLIYVCAGVGMLALLVAIVVACMCMRKPKPVQPAMSVTKESAETVKKEVVVSNLVTFFQTHCNITW